MPMKKSIFNFSSKEVNSFMWLFVFYFYSINIYAVFDYKDYKMVKETQFYALVATDGNKTININNIALIENLGAYTRITLNVKDENNMFIRFDSTVPWHKITSEIQFMDELIQKKQNRH